MIGLCEESEKGPNVSHIQEHKACSRFRYNVNFNSEFRLGLEDVTKYGVQ